MKKVLLSLGAALLLAVGAQAQVSYGLKAGLNLPKFSGDGESSKTATNFYVTGFADIPAAPNFSIQPGVSLQGKGAKDEGDSDFKANLMYIEVPVNAVYYVPAGPGSVFIGAGPYAGYGVSGKYKSGDESVNAFDDEAGLLKLKRFDFGLNFLAGYKLSNGFLINAGYGLGLANIIDADVDGSVKNNVFSVGVGFQF